MNAQFLSKQISEKVNVLCETYRIREAVDPKTGKISAVYLEGVAITFDKPTRNRVSYTYASGQKKYKTLEGKPFLDTHNDTSIRTHPPFGHVEFTDLGTSGGGRVLEYRVNLDPKEETFIHKAKRGDIPGVSIQVLVDNVVEKEDTGGQKYMEATIADFLELSAVLIPGDGDSSMKIVEKFGSESVKPMVADRIGSNRQNDEQEEDLSTQNGTAIIAVTNPEDKRVKPAPEPYDHYKVETKLAKLGIKCVQCETQLLQDIFTLRNNEQLTQLRCYKCGHVAVEDKDLQRRLVAEALFRMRYNT